MGVEYPKFHDTSPALLALKDRIPPEEVTFLAEASQTLSRKRALAMYGDESRNLAPDDIFKRKDALEAYEMAKKAIRICKKLIPRHL